MKKYCFDTSGLSNPLETTPEDIHASLWIRVISVIEGDGVAVTQEIYDEMKRFPEGTVADCIGRNKNALVMDVGQDTWDWESYTNHIARCRKQYERHISEYSGGSSKTICMNDMTIICLAKTLNLPVVSQEALVREVNGASKRRIPNICRSEGVTHMRFNDFLRRENIRL